MTVTAALDALAAQVQALFPTLRVTRNPADLLPPCAYIAAPTGVESALSGAWRLEVPVYLVATAPGDQPGMDPLLDMLPALMRLLGVKAFTPVSLQPSEAVTYPAYRATARITAAKEAAA